MPVQRLLPIRLLLWLLLSQAAAAAEISGTNPPFARVVVASDPVATQAFIPELNAVRRIVDRGVTAFASRPNAAEAWRSFVDPTDVVGFKVVSSPGPISGTRPVVVQALIESLLAAGHSPSRIVIWDKQSHDLRAAGFYALADRLGVRCRSAIEAGWDDTKFYENPLLGRPLFGDLEFGLKEDGVGRKSFVTRLLTREITKLISVAPILNHNLAAVNGHLVSLGFGSVDNTLRFEIQADRVSETLPELAALPVIWDRLAFCVTDALLCQYRGEERMLLHYTIPLNELRLSRDPVALDILSISDINRGRLVNPTPGEKAVKTELYINAAILDLGVAETNHIRVVNAP